MVCFIESAPLFSPWSPSSQETISHKPQLRESRSFELPFQPSRPGGASSSSHLPSRALHQLQAQEHFSMSLPQEFPPVFKPMENKPQIGVEDACLCVSLGSTPLQQSVPPWLCSPGPWVLTVRLLLFMLLPGFRREYICQGSHVLCICFLETQLGYHLHCRCVAPLHSASAPIKSY